MLISPDYYSTLERPNVELVTQGVRELTKAGVVADDGTERPTDVIVLSTGFQTTRFLAPMEIRGERGLDLNEVWREGAKAYLGMTVAGLPEPVRHVRAEHQPGLGLDHLPARKPDGYIADAVSGCSAHGGWLSVRPEVQRAFDREMQSRLSTSVWQTGCSNWYVDENGREHQQLAGLYARVPPANAAPRSRRLRGRGVVCSAQHVGLVAHLPDQLQEPSACSGPRVSMTSSTPVSLTESPTPSRT